jgi:chemotaxis protein histidine kinase CheA
VSSSLSHLVLVCVLAPSDESHKQARDADESKTHTQTHLLPPNLLKLFAPRPPLPYLKPPGRDPDFPLKSLSSKRAPKPILVSEVLEEIRAQQATEEADRDADVVKQDGTAPVKPKHEEQEQEEDNKPEVKAESASQQPAASDGEDATMTSATSTDEKEEGEEAAPPIAKSADAAAPTTTTTAAAAETQSQQKRLTKKPKGPVAGERDDLTAETRFELRRREKKRWQQECMSKPCESLSRLAHIHSLLLSSKVRVGCRVACTRLSLTLNMADHPPTPQTPRKTTKKSAATLTRPSLSVDSPAK